MWGKLFGVGDALPRERVDAVVRVVDRYLSEEAELRKLQTEKQTIHPTAGCRAIDPQASWADERILAGSQGEDRPGGVRARHG